MPLHAPSRCSCFLAICLGLPTGCGPETQPNDDTDPTTVAGTDDSADPSTETDAGPSDTDAQTETDGVEVCEPPLSDEPGPSMATITIRNDAEEPRFIAPWSPFACNYAKLEILVDGASVHWDHERAYPQACDDCWWGCSDGGDMGLVINPGATAEVRWNGAAWTTTPLSEACALEACAEDPSWLPTNCEVLRNLEAVEYVARVHVFDTCPDGVSEDACACDEDVCEIFFYEPGMGEHTAEAGATFPNGATIVLQ